MPRRAATVAGQQPLTGKSYPLGMRVTHDIRTKLEEAARASGRSLTAEAEHRLEDSFRREQSALDALSLRYGDRFARILLAAADAGLYAGRGYGAMVAQDRGDGIENWTDYPTAYQRAVETMDEVFRATRPPGGQKELPATDWKSPHDIAHVILTQANLMEKKLSAISEEMRELREMGRRIKELESRIAEIPRPPMTRRSYGDGALDERSPGVWRLRYRAGGRTFAATFRGSRIEAQRELRRLIKSADDGEHVAPNKITLAQWSEQWLRLLGRGEQTGVRKRRRRGLVSPRTRERYGELLASYVLPKLGHVRLQALTVSQLDDLYIRLEDRISPPRSTMFTSPCVPVSPRLSVRASWSRTRPMTLTCPGRKRVGQGRCSAPKSLSICSVASKVRCCTRS